MIFGKNSNNGLIIQKRTSENGIFCFRLKESKQFTVAVAIDNSVILSLYVNCLFIPSRLFD